MARCLFLELPSEIRLTIYECAIVGPEKIFNPRAVPWLHLRDGNVECLGDVNMRKHIRFNRHSRFFGQWRLENHWPNLLLNHCAVTIGQDHSLFGLSSTCRFLHSEVLPYFHKETRVVLTGIGLLNGGGIPKLPAFMDAVFKGATNSASLRHLEVDDQELMGCIALHKIKLFCADVVALLPALETLKLNLVSDWVGELQRWNALGAIAGLLPSRISVELIDASWWPEAIVMTEKFDHDRAVKREREAKQEVDMLVMSLVATFDLRTGSE